MTVDVCFLTIVPATDVMRMSGTHSSYFRIVFLRKFRVRMAQAEESMRDRVKKACEDLGNVGTLAKEI